MILVNWGTSDAIDVPNSLKELVQEAHEEFKSKSKNPKATQILEWLFSVAPKVADPGIIRSDYFAQVYFLGDW